GDQVDEGGDAESGEADRTERAGCASAEDVCERADRARPADPAEGVPQQESPPRHPIGAREPRRDDAQNGQPPAEEDGRRAAASGRRACLLSGGHGFRLAGSGVGYSPCRRERCTASSCRLLMSPFLLASVVLFLLMGSKLADMYLGGHYACPSCGTKREGRHSSECPWRD